MLSLKNITLIGVLITFLFGLPSNLIAQNKLDEDGKKTGAWTGMYKDGSLRYKGQFKNDIPVDTFYYYYPQGELKTRLVWLKSNESYATMYYSTGEKMAEGRYLDQKKTGKWITYGANEIKVNEGNYLNGKKIELWRTYYINGKVADEVNFISDLEIGPYKAFFETGELKQTASYVDGYRKGETVVYHPNGKIKVKGQFEKDVKDGVWFYYDEEGNLEMEIEYELGKRITPYSEDELLEGLDKYKDNVKDELEFEDMNGTIKYDEQRK